MFEVEVYQKKANRACNIVAAYWPLTPVSNPDFVIMIASMGFVHGWSIAGFNVHGVRPIKCLMCPVGYIIPIVKRKRVVCTFSEWIVMPLVAPALQEIIQVTKELFNESQIDDEQSDLLHRAHFFPSYCEFTCLHVWRWSTCDVVFFWELNEARNEWRGWKKKVLPHRNLWVS